MSGYSKFLKTNNTEESTSRRGVLSSSTNQKVLDTKRKSKFTKGSISEVISQAEPEINYRFYKGKVFETIDLKDEFFINHLPPFERFDGYISTGLAKLKITPQLLSHTEKREAATDVKLTGEFKSHIENIIAHYDNLNSDNGELSRLLKDGFIRKSKIETPLGDSGALRLISVYSKDIENQTTYFDLLFIDFYHLFIPSKHKGISAKNHSREVYLYRAKYCNESVQKHLKADIFNN